MTILKKTVFLVCFCFINLLIAQKKHTLSGIISEKSSNETLIGATIIFPDLGTGTTTNEYGFYSITLPQGTHKAQVSFIGFNTIEKTIEIAQNTKLNFSLTEASESLKEVVITKSVEQLNIRKPQMSVNALSSKTIKEIPVVLGEADVIKAITLLPGVTTAGEGASGFNVRGGAADQNLILLDEATIFNSSHLFGFFSVFNPDAVKDLKLYKGGIPARYGGRVSSVLDIYQKEGNKNKFHGNGGIGIVASRLLLEGPLKKGKGSFLLGGRSSYAHLFLPLFDIDAKAYFYDLNTKLSYKLNDKNNIYLSGYFGRDVFTFPEIFDNTYGNSVANFRWNHLFNDKLFSNLSLIYSDYYYGLTLDFVGFNWNSGIKNFNLKYDLKHYLNDKIKLQYGLNSVYYEFNPGKIEPSGTNTSINYLQLTKKYAFENALYIDTEHKLSDNLTASYGLRLSSFVRLGQDELNMYKDDNPLIYNNELKIYEKADPIKTEKYKRSDVIKSFMNLEPRLSLSYRLNEQSSVKASYNRMSQYLHLISNTSSPTPVDVWAPSGKYIKPQLLNQYAIGYFKTFKNNDYSLEVESFYKNVKNRIDYIDGADLIGNQAIEQIILSGKSRAYGLELLLRKNTGKFKGWLAYTYSKSQQQTKGRTANETGINNGNWYYTPYDKTHDISITGSYQLGKKWQFSTNFLFQTGRPVTYPNSKYEYNGIIIPNYSTRNSNRLTSYHRLDASFKYTPKPNKKKGWRSDLVFGVYNLYNRKNAYSINFNENTDTGKTEATRLAIFGIVPSITYNFRF